MSDKKDEQLEKQEDNSNLVEALVNQNQSLDNFDWSSVESRSNIKETTDSEKEVIALYDASIKELGNNIIEGKVVSITPKEVIVDIDFKSEGIIPLSEFRYNPDLKVGDDVEVMIDKREDKSGQLVLSHRKARTLRAWDLSNETYEKGEIINGYIKARTKGGMIVDVFGLEAFLPGSQIDVKPIRDYDQYVGKTMEFKIVKINHEFRNLVVSHKALIEADIEVQKKEIIGQLEKGQVLEGVVKNITSYGVFIDLGGVDGLIHITDLSWSRINHPSEILQLDQKINVVILDFDDQKTRIQLGLKQLSSHPWEALDPNLKVGDLVKGKVVVLADYGAFVEVVPGVEGLVHVSEMSWSTHLRSAQDFVKVGDEIEAIVLALDREERKMSFGIKQLTPDPWKDIQEKYPIGSKHVGIVRNFTNFGIFVELEEGVDGLVYISDLSWTKKIKTPSEFCNVNDKLEVVVLELDPKAGRLSLGHKQLTPNPWDTYENTYAEGSIHKAEVINIFDKGASIKLDEDIEAFVPLRYLEKEDGSKLKRGSEADFKIIEFNKEFKRIVASHTSIFREEDRKEVEKVAKNTSTSSNNVTSSEKTTLGDIDALAALKKKLDDQNADS